MIKFSNNNNKYIINDDLTFSKNLKKDIFILSLVESEIFNVKQEHTFSKHTPFFNFLASKLKKHNFKILELTEPQLVEDVIY